MRPLTDPDKTELIRRVTAGETLPVSWQKGNHMDLSGMKLLSGK
jgi:hypothetical protein